MESEIYYFFVHEKAIPVLSHINPFLPECLFNDPLDINSLSVTRSSNSLPFGFRHCNPMGISLLPRMFHMPHQSTILGLDIPIISQRNLQIINFSIKILRASPTSPHLGPNIFFIALYSKTLSLFCYLRTRDHV